MSNSTGGFGAPYRAPAGGWPAAPKKYIGPCAQQAEVPTGAATVYKNVTPNLTGEACPEGCAGFCPDPETEAGDCADVAIAVVGNSPAVNCYEASDPLEYLTPDPCGAEKTGEKRVLAGKAWHGRIPFNRETPTGGRYRPEGEDPPTKYRKIVRSAIFEQTTHLEAGGSTTGTKSTVCTAEVDRYSGMFVNSGVEYGAQGADPFNGFRLAHAGTSDNTGWSIDGGESGTILTELFSCVVQEIGCCAAVSGCCAELPSGELPFDVCVELSYVDDLIPFLLNSAGWAAWETAHSLAAGCIAELLDACNVAISKSSSETELSVSISVDAECCVSGNTYWSDGECEGAHFTYEISIVLSEEYSSTMLNADLKTLLAEWDLTDDILMPWRTSCSPVIVVSYDEPDIATNPDDLCYGEDPPEGYTGEMIGSPLPKGYEPYRVVDPDDVPCGLALSIPHATFEAAYVFYRGGAFCFDKLAQVLWGQKMAFVLPQKPSHNFARPCGEDRDYTDIWDESEVPGWCGRATVGSVTGNGVSPIVVGVTNGVHPNGHPSEGDPRGVRVKTGDQVTITGVLGNTAANGTFTITKVTDGTFQLNGTTGNGDWTSGGYAVYVSPAPAAYYWDDNQSKGDFGLLTWTFDFRGDDFSLFDFGESPTAAAIDCSQQQCLRTPCAPAVVFVQPTDANAEYPNALFFDLPDLQADYDFGGLWMREPRPYMSDPLWWEDENTDQEYNQEWLCAMPEGAPALNNPAEELGCPDPETGNCGYASFGACWSV